ncbi:MAG: aromatic ring-hydroxylating dioxygenase subunit alpha [Planctomycetes bacterium]|nr:aromatic ring-hydroxylating dioxygenase subunit alpha [Planctomycetota bacterium]
MIPSLAEKIRSFDPTLPLEQARTIPSSWYRDVDIGEAERCTVFSRIWLAAGRADLVRQPGSFLTAEIAGAPMAVVRDETGTLRAFHNVCRHRAAPVLTEPCGRATRLRCRYHGWTYDLTGRLRGTPEFEGVANFSREDNGLAPLAVEEWGPFVWVSLDPPPCPLAEYLGPLPGRFAALDLGRLRWAGSRSFEVRCNWKVFVDNYLDGGYHVNSVHPGLAGILEYSEYRTEVAGFTSSQISPLRPAEPGGPSETVAQARGGDRAYYLWIFPNVMFNFYAGYLDTNVVLPLGPDRCRVDYEFYFEQTEGPEAQARIAHGIAVSDQIQMEDSVICEEVQRGLGSRAYETGRYSVRREGAVYAFHQLLARHLRETS